MFDILNFIKDEGGLLNFKSDPSCPYYGRPMSKILEWVLLSCVDFGYFDFNLKDIQNGLSVFMNYKTGIYHKYIFSDSSSVVFGDFGDEIRIKFLEEEFIYLDDIFGSLSKSD